MKVETPSAVFAPVQNSVARYAIGGRVSAMEFNTYGNLAGNRSNATLTIQWDILDRTSNQVVLRGESEGSDQESGVTSAAIGGAIAQALGVWLDSDSCKAFRENAAKSSLTSASATSAGAPSAPLESPSPHYAEYGAHDSSEVLRLPVTPAGAHAVIGDVMPAVFSIRIPGGHGSGFIIARTGLALTNLHVVRGLTEFDAVLGDRRIVRGRVLRLSDRDDVALVQVACDSVCPIVALGSAADVQPGMDVFAIGTPISMELQQTLTKGVVSGTRRLGGVVYVQTDAAINPGNSGGPLVSAVSGRAVGISTWKVVGAGVEGINFAVLIDDALTNLGVTR
jgi:S1-C subfamily serine protease